MGLELAKAYVSIHADMSPYDREVAKLRGSLNTLGANASVNVGVNKSGLNTGLAQTRSSLATFASDARSMLGSLAVGGGLALGAAGVAKIGSGLFDAVKKASDFNESLSKVETTFGPSSRKVLDQVDQLAERFGAVRQSTMDASSAFGLMAQAAGLSKAESADVGNQFVKLGLDLASFHNLSDEDAFEKLRSGLAGETEPLRPLGILLSEDAVKAEALAMGLTKVKRELTQQEKVIARISLIQRQAGPAVGDKERTLDSSSNQMKKLAGELENATTEFGKGLQGALQSAIKLAHELGAALNFGGPKGAGEAIGNAAEATVDATRTAIRSPGSVVTSFAASQFDLLGNFSPVFKEKFKEVAESLRQEAEGDVAKTTGKALEHNSEQVAIDQRKAQVEQAKGLLPTLDEGRANLARFAREYGGIAGGFISDVAMTKERNEDAARIRQKQAIESREGARDFGLGLLQAGAGFVAGQVTGSPLARMASMFGGSLVDAATAEKKPFQSQFFADTADFSRDAIQRSLSGEDTPKEQLEELKTATKHLSDIKETAEKLLGGLAKRPVVGAILRGAS